ncbi:MAG: DUF4912 domain-containing protein, partial [Pseudomonadota bacterium]
MKKGLRSPRRKKPVAQPIEAAQVPSFSSTAAAKEIKQLKPPLDFYPVLPQLAGPDCAVLMLVSPRLLYIYWRATPPPGSAELCLDVSADSQEFEEVQREGFDFRVSNWYLRSRYVDCYARVRLGIWEGQNFRTVLTSNTIQIPREGPGQEPERWMTLQQIKATHPERARRFPRRIERREHPIRTAGYPTYSFEGTPSKREEPKLLKKARELQIKNKAKAYFTLVLHAHLPYVRHPERDFFLEEHWLFEGITETYLPLLGMLERFAKEDVDASLTMSLTPTLIAMLRDPLLMDKYSRHLDRMCELAGRETDRTRGDSEFARTVHFYQDRLEGFRRRFQVDYGRDLVAQFARMEEAGHLEIITCAATHGFLPHLSLDPKAVWAQIAVGVEEHRKQIGKWPKGIWIPECAYFEGLDEMLAAAGMEFFFVDTHAIDHASSPAKMGPYGPIFTPGGVASFARDIESSVEVWSSKEGYPGDFAYRDFYRDIGFDLPTDYMRPYLDPAGVKHMTGFKYYRITGKSDQKEPYKRI